LCCLAGNSVDVYIPDTGIRYSHQVFGGWASFGGYDAFGGQGYDDNAHETHCARLAVGRLTGVAWGLEYIGVYYNLVVMYVYNIVQIFWSHAKPHYHFEWFIKDLHKMFVTWICDPDSCVM